MALVFIFFTIQELNTGSLLCPTGSLPQSYNPSALYSLFTFHRHTAVPQLVQCHTASDIDKKQTGDSSGLRTAAPDLRTVFLQS